MSLPDIPAGAGALAGVISMLAGLYWALVKGSLVTGTQHREIVAIKDQQIASADAQTVMWRAVSETNSAQTSELLEHARLSTQILTSIQAEAKAANARAKP